MSLDQHAEALRLYMGEMEAMRRKAVDDAGRLMQAGTGDKELADARARIVAADELIAEQEREYEAAVEWGADERDMGGDF